LKKSKAYPGSLRRYFEQTFGQADGQHKSPAFRAAMDNYVSSMAGYSIVSYLLAIKDR
jgi:phosphatidylinositol kinase/protein kinase (PI-3  family)